VRIDASFSDITDARNLIDTCASTVLSRFMSQFGCGPSSAASRAAGLPRLPWSVADVPKVIACRAPYDGRLACLVRSLVRRISAEDCVPSGSRVLLTEFAGLAFLFPRFASAFTCRHVAAGSYRAGIQGF